MLELNNYEKADLKTYQHLMGKLIYLLCETRLEIAFAIRQLNKRNINPKIGYLKVKKRVIQYLKGTMHLRIMYGANKVKILLYGLVRYGNSNYAKEPKNSKSVMRYCFFINGGMVSWCSKKQRTVSISTIETEYIALGYTVQENVSIKQFLNELRIADFIEACIFHGDNKISIILTKNVESQTRIKHINVQYHYVRKLVVNGELAIK